MALNKKAFIIFSCILLGALSPFQAYAQEEVADSLWQIDMEDIVVTATRGARELSDVPIATSVITREEVKLQGARRVSELLGEQTGLILIEEFGTGIQLQGLDATYTLILIDGEPVIGREGGTLDLDRLAVADIERVEIVRGPLSSLYGSEALAGVINLITKKPVNGFSGHADVNYETHNTVDASLIGNVKHNRVGLRLQLNRYSSNGYDLFPDLPGLTLPGFTDLSGTSKLVFEQNDRTTWSLNARVAEQHQNNIRGLFLNNILVEFDEDATRTDWSLNPRVVHTLAPGVKITGQAYASDFETASMLRDRLNEENIPDETNFSQAYRKGEVQLDAVLGQKHIVVMGSGYIRETVRADRVRGGKRSNNNTYGFVQHEWLPNDVIDVVTSARLDVHSDYNARVSPKFAILVKPYDWLRLRASAGSGFKAPTFQQLYMDFTNPAAGYSVLGSADILQAVDELENQNQIQYYLTDPASIEVTGPESAVAFNLGVEITPSDRFHIQTSFFRNNVDNLIETLPVAIKTNGQSVFTYVNLNKIYTQGVSAELHFKPFAQWSASVGYQFLDAKDRDVQDDIDAGQVYRRVNGRDVRVQASDYGGLFNRSRHSGNFRITYAHPAWGLSATLRGIYRSRYGFGDLNGNLILDDDSEYVSGYMLLNTTVTKDFRDNLSVQMGIKNGFDEINPEYIPSLSGRLFFVGLRYTFNQ